MIKHESFVNIHIKDRTLFDRIFDATTLKAFIKNIEKEMETSYDTTFKNTFDTKYNFLGDMFEIFAECFFTLLKADNRIGICNYIPTKKTEDNGVDGYGIGFDGKPATVQVKFRGNPTEELTERDIKNFGFQSVINFNVDKDTKTNLVIFTSAAGLHWHTSTNVFQGRMRSINYEMISSIVDNNKCFWFSLKELVQESKNFYFSSNV